jgi:ribose 5-phosphate isomerase B
MKIVIASDHAGFQLKSYLCETLGVDHGMADLGCHSEQPVDYPDYVAAMAKHLQDHPKDFGILICGSGVGMSIAANRYSHIRATLCHSAELAAASRDHNNANVLVLGARLLEFQEAKDIAHTFLSTPFSQDERHIRRLSKLGNNL